MSLTPGGCHFAIATHDLPQVADVQRLLKLGGGLEVHSLLEDVLWATTPLSEALVHKFSWDRWENTIPATRTHRDCLNPGKTHKPRVGQASNAFNVGKCGQM